MTSNKTKHPLPHPTGRAGGVPNPSVKNFFKNNYFLKEYEQALHGHDENQEIKFLIKMHFGNPAPPPVKPTRLNRYGEMLS
jgi:hypothetical protein